jgi:hypothetical protein
MSRQVEVSLRNVSERTALSLSGRVHTCILYFQVLTFHSTYNFKQAENEYFKSVSFPHFQCFIKRGV